MKLTVIDLVERKTHGVEESELPIDTMHDEILKHWMEDPAGPQGFAITQPDGWPVLVILRDSTDPEIAHVMWTNGNRYSWRCRYVLDADGQYERTEVTALSAEVIDVQELLREIAAEEASR